MKWIDSREIAIALAEKHPDVDPERVVGAERGRLDVVLHPYGPADLRRDETGEVEVLDGEVDRVRHTPRRRVDRAGDADADRGEGGGIEL